MNPSQPDDFRTYVRLLKRNVIAAFSQGIQMPVPGNAMTLEELINVNAFARLGDFIDQYHAPFTGEPPPSTPGVPRLPGHADSEPSIHGLLRYLERHWLPTLLEQTTEGVELILNIDTSRDDRVDFSLGLRPTPEAFHRVEGQNPSADLLGGLQRELDG